MLSASDFIWDEVTRLIQDRRTVRLAVGSIGVNYAEAYSRSTDRDRCRLYEYSNGSAREARDWTYKARRVIGPERTAILLNLFSQIIRMLTVTVVRERTRASRLSRRIRQKSTPH